MINKTIALIAGLIACATSTFAADFIEIKRNILNQEKNIDNIRIPLESGIANHSEITELTSPEDKVANRFYYGYQLQANTSKNGIEVSLLVNRFEGFVELSPNKYSPVLTTSKNKFLIKKPSTHWTKVTAAKDTTYEVRWITE